MGSEGRGSSGAAPTQPPANPATPLNPHRLSTHSTLAPPPLAPVATTKEWLPALQSLRGLAAVWVALYHLQVLLVAADIAILPVPGIRLGWLGVDLFFVLSAFLLGQPFIDGRPPRTERFYLDRFLRIAPPYYAAFLLSTTSLLIFLPGAFRPENAWWSLIFMQNWHFDGFLAVNPAFWSLAVELQFYLILPLMAPLFRSKWWPAWLAAFLAVALLYRGLLFPGEVFARVHLTNFTLPSFIGHFALGLAICRIRRLDASGGSGVRRATFLAGIPLVLLPPLLWIPSGSVNFGFDSLAGCVLVRPLAACGFALIILATASGGWVAQALAWTPIDWLGRISYSLYLVHIPIQVMVSFAVSPTDDVWGWAILSLAASIVGGWLMYVGIEAPAERWRRRRKARLLRRSAAPTLPG